MQYSTPVRNAKLDAIETTVGTSPLFRLYTGSIPSNCAAASTGVKQAEGTLPSDWLASASGGSKSLLGTWQATGVTGVTTATVGYFRIYDSAGTNCGIQGTVGLTGSGADAIIDNSSVAAAQVVNVITFTINENNG